jgi:hypothetical protein
LSPAEVPELTAVTTTAADDQGPRNDLRRRGRRLPR